MDDRYIARAWVNGNSASAEEEFEAEDTVDARDPGEPTDLWAVEELPRNMDISAGCVPAFIYRFARERSRSYGTNLAPVALPAIVSLASLIHAASRIHLRQTNDNWFQPPILWGAVVGRSGDNKSSPYKAGIEFPRAVEHAWHAEYRRELAAKEFKRQKMKQDRKPAPSPEERPAPAPKTDGAVILTADPEPKFRQKITSDATTEAISAVLADNPSGLLFACDELTGFFGRMDAYSARAGKDRPFWLEAYEGGPRTTNRRASGSVYVPNCAVSVIGTIQPSELAKLAKDTGDGMLQRFIFAFVDQRDRGEDIPDDIELKRAAERIAHLIADIPPIDFRLDQGAAAELDALHAFVDQNLSVLDEGPLKDWLAKAPNKFGRMALVFHLIEWASESNPLFEDEPPAKISKGTASIARRFIEDFAYPNARVAFSNTDEIGSHARWVAEHILANDLGEITRRRIQQNYTALRKQTEKIAPAMDRLVAEGWLLKRAAGWGVNPLVHDGRFGRIAELEKIRRSEAKEAIKAEGHRRRTASA